jgi:hypothetical protein
MMPILRCVWRLGTSVISAGICRNIGWSRAPGASCAMGYVAGARNVLTFVRGTSPGPPARAYVERFREYWP